VADCGAPEAVAEMTDVCALVTTAVDTEKPALLKPAGTVMLCGTNA
jgi:hypothetical protein